MHRKKAGLKSGSTINLVNLKDNIENAPASAPILILCKGSENHAIEQRPPAQAIESEPFWVAKQDNSRFFLPRLPLYYSHVPPYGPKILVNPFIAWEAGHENNTQILSVVLILVLHLCGWGRRFCPAAICCRLISSKARWLQLVEAKNRPQTHHCRQIRLSSCFQILPSALDDISLSNPSRHERCAACQNGVPANQFEADAVCLKGRAEVDSHHPHQAALVRPAGR